jgi:hypothetical protein
VSGFAQNPLDRCGRHPVEVGHLGDRQSVFHESANARPFVDGDLRRRRLRADRRFDRFVTNRCRQDRQNARLSRVGRLQGFRNRLFGDLRFRREKRLGGRARSHDLLAIVAGELALLLRAVGQEAGSNRLDRSIGREFGDFRKPQRVVAARGLSA